MNFGDWITRDEEDRRIIRDVYESNEYCIPEDMKGWCVLDIGAHIGAFSRLAAERGATVTAVEPSRDNYRLLSANLAFISAYRIHGALRSAEGPCHLRHGANAGHTVCRGRGSNGEDVQAYTLGYLSWVALRKAGTERVDLCKIDAEGVEYEVIESADFGDIMRLDIEFHAHYVSDWNRRTEECRKRLASLGFVETRWQEAHADQGWYRLYTGVRQ